MSKNSVLIGLVWAILTIAGVVWLPAQTNPTIGEVAANPAYVVVNTDTSVLFTAHIPFQAQPINVAKVVRVASNGKNMASLGTLHDDGLNGDAVAGDRVFSLRAFLNLSTVGEEYYRVVASFSGVHQLLQSAVATLSVWNVVLNSEIGLTIKYPPSLTLLQPDDTTFILHANALELDSEGSNIAILVHDNPQNLPALEFYGPTFATILNVRPLIEQSNGQYRRLVVGALNAFEFVPFVTFAGETVVVIEGPSKIVEVTAYGTSSLENNSLLLEILNNLAVQ